MSTEDSGEPSDIASLIVARSPVAGHVIGRHQLVRCIGEGPLGVVWLAADAAGGTAAVKLFRPEVVRSAKAAPAFKALVADGNPALF